MSAPICDKTEALIASLEALSPLIAEQRAAFDKERRLTDDVYAALADAGLFRLWLPRSHGGPELSPLAFMEVVEAAAALDGSIGWLVGNGGGMSRVGGYLPPEVAREIFADPRAFVVSATGGVGTLEPAEGGWRLSGRWPFGSGAPHASHFMGLAAVGGVADADRPLMLCCVPRAEIILHDTWHVSGLRGTGSADFEMRDVFVPAAHAHPFLDPAPSEPGLLYRMPTLAVFAWTVAVVPLGIARGALDTFAALASRKARQGAPTLLRDRETVQASVGRAKASLLAARALLIEAMRELMAATDLGGQRLVEARATLRLAAAHAAESAVAIVDRLEAEAGAVAIFESCALERAVRDVHAAVKHVAMSPASYILAGRMTLGLDPGTPRF
ncbi:acyl-CoA dehydrogenase family protein [Acuticoccus kandeliae]|uniref:acyl-CoA dehydrogenase family protein n=1 Tax=Acuticoccus kandeliae TaxID=2073160 RepID=UPI000D3ECAFC|nr:acyl-CoA dehydrogenase family protein [Acuticoccus kandeliae]